MRAKRWNRFPYAFDRSGDEHFHRLVLNAGKLLGANGIAAIIGFMLTVLTARTLGPEQFGFLTLILAYQMTVSRLTSFNVWQAIIKYGSEALELDDQQNLRRLINFGFCLDVGSAVVGAALAITFSGLVIDWLNWDESLHPLLILYSWLILFTLNGTPTGILRLFNRFDLLSYTSVVSVSIRLFGVVLCLFIGLGLVGFVWVYLITGIVGQVYLLAAALWVLRKQRIGNIFRQTLQDLRKRFPGIWDYVWTTNVNSTTRLLSSHADELIIAGLTSPAALGVYKIAKQFSYMLSTFVDPLYQSIYPELAKLWASEDRTRFFSLAKRATLIASGLAAIGWLAFIVFGRWLIVLTVGHAYQDAYLLASVYMLAIVIALGGSALHPSMLAIGEPRRPLTALLASTAFYLAILFPLVSRLGLVGAPVAYTLFYVAWTSLMISFLRPYVRFEASA